MGQWLWSQQGIQGTIFDAETGEVLIGATIQLETRGDISSFDGSFKIETEAGNQTLTASYVGYETNSLPVNVLEGEFTDVQIGMKVTQMMLETATVTGSKFEKSVAKAPVSISVIQPSLIAATNTANISTLLDKVPGVQIIDGQANIRGGSGFSYGAGSRVMLLIDDMPALQVDAGRPNWGDIPVENINQIEVIKGASSVLYGSSALNGIIHVRTKYATSEPETKISGSYVQTFSPADPEKQWWDESPSLYNVSLLHKQKINKLDVVLHGFYEDEDKYFLNEGDLFDPDDDRPMYQTKFRGGLNTRYRISDRTTVGLNLLYNRFDDENYFLWKNGSSGNYINLPGGVTSGLRNRMLVDPSFTHFDKKGGRHKLLTRFYYINNDNNNNQSNSSKSYYAEYQYLKNFEDAEITYTGGVSALITDSDAQLFGDTTFNSQNFALYSQVEKTLIENLDVIFGLRMESNVQKSPENFMGFVIPDGKDVDTKFIARAAFNYGLTDYTFLRGSWGQGYRYPTVTERFITTSFGGFNIFPNPELEPETGWSAELGLKQGYSFLGVNGFVDVAGFVSRYDNMMEFTFANIDNQFGFRSENVGNIQINGVEFNVRAISQLSSNIPVSLLAGYTFIDPIYRNFDGNESLQSSLSTSRIRVGSGFEEVTPENVLKYRSKHNIKADFETGYKNFRLGATLVKVSHMINVDLLLENFADIRAYRGINNQGYMTLDGRLSYEQKDLFGLNSIKLSLILKNALNEEYTVRPGFIEAPRNGAIRLDITI